MTGMSITTVSRALSDPKKVKYSTRLKIESAMKELQIQSRNEKSGIIGIIVPDIFNQFFPLMLEGINSAADDFDNTIMLCNSGPDLRQEKTVVKLLLGRQVDGILIVPQSPKTYENIQAYTSQVPTVFLGENLRDQPQSYVAADNSWGTYIGTRYLWELGHREILYFGRRHTTTHQLRAEGYMRACQELGLKLRFYNSEYSRSSIENGYQMAKDLFSRPIDYSAIFASTDSNALGILKAADELGIRIPDRLSLIGFDDIPSTGLPRIELTTIEQPKRAMAVQAVEMLRDRIENGTQGYAHQILMPALVKRETCASLR